MSSSASLWRAVSAVPRIFGSPSVDTACLAGIVGGRTSTIFRPPVSDSNTTLSSPARIPLRAGMGGAQRLRPLGRDSARVMGGRFGGEYAAPVGRPASSGRDGCWNSRRTLDNIRESPPNAAHAMVPQARYTV